MQSPCPRTCRRLNSSPPMTLMPSPTCSASWKRSSARYFCAFGAGGSGETLVAGGRRAWGGGPVAKRWLPAAGVHGTGGQWQNGTMVGGGGRQRARLHKPPQLITRRKGLMVSQGKGRNEGRPRVHALHGEDAPAPAPVGLALSPVPHPAAGLCWAMLCHAVPCCAVLRCAVRGAHLHGVGIGVDLLQHGHEVRLAQQHLHTHQKEIFVGFLLGRELGYPVSSLFSGCQNCPGLEQSTSRSVHSQLEEFVSYRPYRRGLPGPRAQSGRLPGPSLAHGCAPAMQATRSPKAPRRPTSALCRGRSVLQGRGDIVPELWATAAAESRQRLKSSSSL